MIFPFVCAVDLPRKLLHELLSKLGAKHPQALVYPLFVALKSPREDRRAAAKFIMSSLRQDNAVLVDQALMVSQELIRVAILLQETWHEALEEASRQFFGEQNIKGMLDTLIPLHEHLNQNDPTAREESFYVNYFDPLREAFQNITLYLLGTNPEGDTSPSPGPPPNMYRGRRTAPTQDRHILRAWDHYYAVFKKINQSLPHITALELQNVSPALLCARDLILAVPGTYSVDGSLIRIQSFHPTVLVIRSKQRPRKIRILGEDGQEFVFLLKVGIV